jgi:hypothetical protein
MRSPLRRLALLAGSLCLALAAAAAPRLPRDVQTALARAKMPPEAVAIVVQDVGSTRSRLARQADAHKSACGCCSRNCCSRPGRARGRAR